MKAIILVFTLLISSIGLNAQYDIAASSMHIEHQKDKKYKIILNLVRPCDGRPLPNSLKISVESAGCTNSNYNLTNVKIKKLSFSCLDSFGIKYDGCAVPNQMGSAGFELFTYEAIIDFNQAIFNQSCCDYSFKLNNGTFFWYSGITSGQALKTAGAEIKMDLCALRRRPNSSPRNAHYFIVPMTLNQPTYTNFGFSDVTDFDSISYEFVAPIDGSGNNLSYKSGYSAQGPMSDILLDTFYLNKFNGDIIGTATKNNEFGLTCLLVKEYRKDSLNQYQIIATYRNDVLFASYKPFANNAPKLLGPFAFQVCEGEKLCFDVRSKDDPVIVPPPGVSPPADTTIIKWSNSIPNATFKIKDLTVRERIGEFCWEPQVGDGSRLPYTFTVTASEKRCLHPVSTTRGYSVTVLELPKLEKNIQVINGNEFIIRTKVLNPYSKNLSCLMTLKNLDQTQIVDTRSLSTHPWNDSIFEFRTPYNIVGKFLVELVFNDSKNCPLITIDTVEFAAPTDITKIESNINLRYDATNKKLEWNSSLAFKNIQLIDMAGKVILEKNLEKNASQIAIPSSASGVYIVLIQSAEGLIRKKVWIE